MVKQAEKLTGYGKQRLGEIPDASMGRSGGTNNENPGRGGTNAVCGERGYDKGETRICSAKVEVGNVAPCTDKGGGQRKKGTEHITNAQRGRHHQ